MYNIVYSTEENMYELYEKKSSSLYNRRCIDNTITGCNKCVGYCQYREHPGFLTEKQRVQHNCIGKKCFYYIAKPKKKKAVQIGNDFSTNILALIHNLMNNEEYIKVVRVEKTERNRYIAFYVTITNQCQFEKYSVQIESKLGVQIEFVKLNYEFDRCVSLLCAN